ncbi:sporulation protein YpjB [Cohnella panacarvi]|uniref:sporulation protein YpjB n=1 Tax=Cohnella panacarvi TaxID=400776 RepID=UPI00047DB308|nr:sporulation protein YpjB [Cohnella panacarvi]
MRGLKSARRLGLSVVSAVALLLALPGAANGGVYDSDAVQHGSEARDIADVSSSSLEEYDHFLRSATVLYRAVNEDDVSLMSQSAVVVQQRYDSLPLSDAALIDGMQALGEQLKQTKRSIALAAPDKRRLKEEAASLLLAADAMANPTQPLWHDYRTVIAEDLRALRVALNGDGGETVRGADLIGAGVAVNRLRSHYGLIRTSALLETAPLNVVRGDSVLRYASIVIGSESSNLALAHGALQPLEEALLAVFPGASDEPSAVVPAVAGASWGWTAMMGSFIVTVLTWAGWRRYKDEGVAGMTRKNDGEVREDAAERLLKRWRNR